MLLLLAVLALAAVYLGYRLVSRARFYNQFFGDPHLAEVAAALPALRQAASDNLDRPEPPKPILLPDALARAPLGKADGGSPPPHASHAAINRQTNLSPSYISPLGLVVLYTIRSRPQDGGFIHHVSVSLGGGYTPHGVGAHFLLFVLRGLGVDPQKVRCGMPPSHIFHAEWNLSAAQHAEHMARAVPVTANPRELFDECVRLRPQIPFAVLTHSSSSTSALSRPSA